MSNKQFEPQLGDTLEYDEVRRDAIHIAIAPVFAACTLSPGEKVSLIPGTIDKVGPDQVNPIGVVDPFLDRTIAKGEKFWMLLNPYSITGLRHVWSHQAFTNAYRGNNE